MSLSYRKKILIDCSQSKSESSTLTEWTNKLPESLILTKDSTLSVYNAYINKRGSDQSTIDIEPAKNFNKANVQETNITLSYYKNATGLTIPMPYNYAISSIQKNIIVARDNQNNLFYASAVNTGPNSTIKEFKDYNQDTGQKNNDPVNLALVNNYATFAYCTDLRPDNEFISRLGAMPYGNLEAQSEYHTLGTGAAIDLYNNIFKSYLIDGCQPLDGSRCKTHEFNILTNKYEIVTKNIIINIPPDSYTPNQLGTLISNQLNNTENNKDLTSENIHTSIEDLRNVLDENNQKTGLYFETPCSDKGLGLYQSRQKINGFYQYSPAPNVIEYPSESPIVKKTNIETGAHPTSGVQGLGFFFNPVQDNFYECGKTDLTKVGNNYTGERCDAYYWSMMSNNLDIVGDKIPARVHFRFPETLYHAQELCEGLGLSNLDTDNIDFNSNVKKNILPGANPNFITPNLTYDNTTRNQGGTGYLKNKGDYNGYILTSLKWNKNNLLKVKNFFDAQQKEGIQESIYSYDWAFNDTPLTFNLSSRNQTIRGSLDSAGLDGLEVVNKGTRYIHIGQRNDEDLIDAVNNPENVGRGGTPALTDFSTGLPVYRTATNPRYFPLMSFGSDYLGSDANMGTNPPAGSPGTSVFFKNNDFKFKVTRTDNTITQDLFVGMPYLEGGGTYKNRPCTYSHPSQNIQSDADPDVQPVTGSSDRKLNGSFDILAEHVKYSSHLQLIEVRPNYTDRRGDKHLFDFPVQLSDDYINGNGGDEFDKLMEDFGFGYCYKYTSATDDPNTKGEDYIMLFVSRDEGGLQRDVLSYFNNGSGTFKTSQSLFWNPFFSSGGCNSAIMDLIGQGTNLGTDTTIEASNGNVNLETYPLSIMEVGGGSLLPQIAFNQDQNRYAFSDLYTPFTSTNSYTFRKPDGTDPGTGIQNPNAGNEVIIFNRNFNKYYKVNTKFNNNLTTATSAQIQQFFNLLNSINEIMSYNFIFKPSISEVNAPQSNSMYYSQSGIYIEKWIEKNDAVLGLVIPETEDNFNNSIWFLLGFTYSQTHNDSFLIRKKGLQLETDTNIPNFRKFRNSATINENGTLGNNLYYSMPITNNTDLYNTDFNNLLFVNPQDLTLFINQGSNNVNTLEIISSSTEFIADRLPVRNSIPYFIIVSDILSKSGLGLNFYSQDNLLSAVDIVQQSVNTSDFYEYSGNMIHEINTEYQINAVTHQIFKSNGDILNTNEFSAVIYLAEVNVIVGLNPSQQQFYQEERVQIKKEKEESDKLLDILENPKTQKEKIMSNLLKSNLIIRQEYDIESKNIEEIIEEIETE